MKLFGPLYERAIGWAKHPRAPTLLTVLSFFEAIIFPVMPEVMLAPMALAQPKRGFWFATLSLAGSMVGALVGYALGHYAFEALKPLFAAMGMLPAIESGIVTAAAPALVNSLIEQLAVGAHLVAPVGGAASQSLVKLTKREDGGVDEQVLAPVVFVPLLAGTLD